MHGIDLLRKHGVPFNTLTTVNAINAPHATEVYRFLRSVSDYMQFLPVEECVYPDKSVALPPCLYFANICKVGQRANFNVSPVDCGRFLCSVFDVWRQEDVGKKFVQIFEATFGNLMRLPAGVCVHEAVCGHCAAMECNGDVYRCDRYVFDEYKMGNIMKMSLGEMIEANRDFGEYKLDSLSSACLHCDVADLCFGVCPKDRFAPHLSEDGEEPQNYLCEGYRLFFRYFKQSMRNLLISPKHSR